MDKTKFKMMVNGEYISTMTVDDPFETHFRTNPFKDGYYPLIEKDRGVTCYLHPENMSAVVCVFGGDNVLPEKIKAVKLGSVYVKNDSEDMDSGQVEVFVVKKLYVRESINTELEIPATVEDVYVDRLAFLRNDHTLVANCHQNLRFRVIPDDNVPLEATPDGSLYAQGQERLLYLQTSAYNECSVVRLPDGLNEIDDFAIMNLQCKELHVPEGVTRFPLSKSFSGIIYFNNKMEDVEIFCPETDHDYTTLDKQMCTMLRFRAPEYNIQLNDRVCGHLLTLTKVPQAGDLQWCWTSEVKVNANYVEAIMPMQIDCTDKHQGTRILMSHHVIDVYEDMSLVSDMLASYDRKNRK